MNVLLFITKIIKENKFFTMIKKLLIYFYFYEKNYTFFLILKNKN